MSFSIIYSLDINPLVRHTLWSQVLGGVFYWVQTNAGKFRVYYARGRNHEIKFFLTNCIGLNFNLI